MKHHRIGGSVTAVIEVEVVGDPGIEPGVRLREGVTVPCHTLRPVAHYQVAVAPDVWRDYKRTNGASTGKSQVFLDGSKILFAGEQDD